MWEPTKIKDIYCPKYKKRNNLRSLLEVWGGAVIDFDVEGNVRDGQGNKKDGDSSHVIAICNCNHEWKLKGVMQVTELDN